MKKIYFLFLLIFLSFRLPAQSLYFPPLSGNTWDTLSPASLGWCTNQVDTLYDYLQTNNTKAFLLLKDGKIVLEKYFGTFTQDSLWYWASAAKTITSFLTGIAQQEGYLSISDTSSQYLGNGWTACTPQQEEKITIRHQLTMSSGLDDGVPDNHCTIDSCLVYLSDAGTRWAYHNAPYTLIDSVIEVATGVSLNLYTYQKLLQPTGMSGVWLHNGYDNVFYSKPRTMARYGLMILAGGMWNGNPLMTDTAYFHQMLNTSQQLNPSYGYLWWLNGKPGFMVPGLQLSFPGPLMNDAPMDMVAALGKNGQFINVVPSQNLVLVRMGNAPAGGDVPFLMNDTIWQKLNLVICNGNSIAPAVSLNNRLSVFPNPAQDRVTVELPAASYELQLLNVTGSEILRRENCREKTELSLSDLPQGLYFLRVEQDGVVVVRKLVICL